MAYKAKRGEKKEKKRKENIKSIYAIVRYKIFIMLEFLNIMENISIAKVYQYVRNVYGVGSYEGESFNPV